MLSEMTELLIHFVILITNQRREQQRKSFHQKVGGEASSADSVVHVANLGKVNAGYKTLLRKNDYLQQIGESRGV